MKARKAKEREARDGDALSIGRQSGSVS